MQKMLITATISGVLILTACDEAVLAPGPETSNAPKEISAHQLAMAQNKTQNTETEAAGQNTASDTGETTSSATSGEKTDKVSQVETGRGTEDTMAVGRDTTDDKIVIEKDTETKVVTVPKEAESGETVPPKSEEAQSAAQDTTVAGVPESSNPNTSAPVSSGASSPTATAPSREEGLALAKKSGCLVCHDIDKKVVGPPWMEVSKRYAGDSTAKAQLIEKVHKGGKGNWTEVTGGAPMPPYSPRVSDENIENLVTFVLSLAQQ